MALTDLIATDADKLADREMRIEMLQGLLREIYDALSKGKTVSESLLAHIRIQMASGRK